MTKLELLKTIHGIQNKIQAVTQQLDISEQEQKGDNNEMVDPVIAGFISQLDDATNKIAARLQNLVDNSGLNAESKAAMQAEIDKVAALGQDPNNPLPGNGTGTGDGSGSQPVA